MQSRTAFSRIDDLMSAAANDNRFSVVSQTDAVGNVTTIAYDVLGRTVERKDTALGGSVSFTDWYYDHAAMGVGKLGITCTSAASNPACAGTVLTAKAFTYDTKGRPASSVITVDGSSYTYATAYNATNGAVDTVTYPSTLVVKSIYNTYGYACRLTDGTAHTCTDASDLHVLWTAKNRDAELHLADQVAGNNAFETTQSYDATTGLLRTVRAGPSGSVAQFDYTYDTIGNLRYRSDDLQGVFEYSCYDALNRLQYYAAGNHATACQTPGTGGTAKTVVYDAFGNITNKSDVGTYAYAAAGGTRPHGVKGVTGSLNGVTNPYFYYDPNGNMACESTSAATTFTACASAVKTVSWTAFNMVAQMAQATTTIAFTYDSDRSRIKQVCTGPSCVTATTYYLNDPASGAMSEKAVAGATTTWRDYLAVDGKIIAERFLPVGGAASWKFFVLDHLGSIAVVADSAGTVSENLAYDAWGRRRSATDGSDLSQCTVTSVTTRGFINQEQMDGGVCLDNLNARIYDPTLGRFLSADPMIGDPYTSQQLNRYTYSLNNPLSLSDPNGLCFLGCAFKNPLVEVAISIAIAAVVPYAFFESWAAFTQAVAEGTSAAFEAVVTAGAISGAATSGMNGGNILRGMLSGAFEAAAFMEVGSYVNGLEKAGTVSDIQGAMLRIGLHGMVGGIASVANKSNFGAGFLAAGFGAAADAAPTDGMVEGTIVHAVAGGVGSVLGGGKFENGAETGAFGYLFNQAAHGGIGHNGGPPLDDGTAEGIGLLARIIGLFRATPIGLIFDTATMDSGTSAHQGLVQPEGIATIEAHLARLDALDYPPNAAMLERLRAGSESIQDLAFYEHELHEAELMSRGMDDRSAHLATLKWQHIPFERGYLSRLFAPEVIQKMPQYFQPEDLGHTK
jgi:RHS repeat-associated protein